MRVQYRINCPIITSKYIEQIQTQLFFLFLFSFFLLNLLSWTGKSVLINEINSALFSQKEKKRIKWKDKRRIELYDRRKRKNYIWRRRRVERSVNRYFKKWHSTCKRLSTTCLFLEASFLFGCFYSCKRISSFQLHHICVHLSYFSLLIIAAYSHISYLCFCILSVCHRRIYVPSLEIMWHSVIYHCTPNPVFSSI